MWDFYLAFFLLLWLYLKEKASENYSKLSFDGDKIREKNLNLLSID